MKLLLATQNRHKVEELTALLDNYDFEVRSLLDYPAIGEIVEYGDTLEANAFIKARKGFEFTGLPTIADDTGLFVNALHGAPGVYAARFAGEQASYDDNVNKLLDKLEDIPEGQRQARFQTAAIFVDSTHEIVATGEVKGEITRQRQGDQGFGYDPIFYIPEKKKTYAQMCLEEKNELSHRKRAFKALLKKLEQEHPAFSAELP